MEDYKSDEDNHSENFQLNDPKGETDKLSNSELWNHLDHNQSSFKISGLFENLHINDEVEEKKAYKHTYESPSFIDSRERSLYFRRKSDADLDNSLKSQIFLNILLTENFDIESCQLWNLSWFWRRKDKKQVSRRPDRSFSSKSLH